VTVAHSDMLLPHCHRPAGISASRSRESRGSRPEGCRLELSSSASGDVRRVLRMTTVVIDDELGRLVGEAAKARGKTLQEFTAEALRRLISGNSGVRRAVRNGIPVMLVANEIPAIDPDKIRRCLEEEGL